MGWAQDADDGVEIMRNATDLNVLLRDRPEIEPDLLDTALVLTNQINKTAVATCVAFDAQGDALGRGWVKIPGRGVRILLASDLVNGFDFVGSIRCSARGEVFGSAFILGAGFSDTPVTNTYQWQQSRVHAQAVVSR